MVCHVKHFGTMNGGLLYTGWAKKTGPLCSAEILLRSARFFAEIKVV